jgi:predicted transcriptional regulator
MAIDYHDSHPEQVRVGNELNKLGPTELEVLRFVVEHNPVRVGEVAEHMAKTSGQARTTVLTTMERLRRKKYLKRQKLGGTWHYVPTQSKSELLESLIGDFVHRVLRGSLSPFAAWLANADGITPEEIQLLKQRILELEAEHRKDG